MFYFGVFSVPHEGCAAVGAEYARRKGRVAQASRAAFRPFRYASAHLKVLAIYIGGAPVYIYPAAHVRAR